MSGEVAVAVGGRTLTLSNLDKVLFAGDGFTKSEVIDYYARIGPVLLPYVADRALTRLRFPDGVLATPPAAARAGSTPPAPGAFYEKNAPAGTPDWVRRQRVRTSDGVVDYVLADEPATLVWLANLAALELHVPQWTVGSGARGADGVLDLPGEVPRSGDPLADRLVVDLDPGDGVGVVEAARAALIVAERLIADGLLPVAQTSGSKGVQLYAALKPCPSRDAWAYAKGLNAVMARQQPRLFAASMALPQRTGRVYLDYNQNLAARNTVGPYSLRGRERPYVATPVTWEELGAVEAPEDLRFTTTDVLERVDRLGDLAADLLLPDRPELPRLDRLMR